MRWKNALHQVIWDGNCKELDVLEINNNINVIERGVTPLQLSCLVGNEEVVERVIDRGLVLNAAFMEEAGWWGAPPLWIATVRCNEAVVQLLLDRGVSLRSVHTRVGTAAVHVAALHAAHSDAAKAILRRFLERDATCAELPSVVEGWTAL